MSGQLGSSGFAVWAPSPGISPGRGDDQMGCAVLVSWWVQDLVCHCTDLGLYCGAGSVPGLATSACRRCSQKKKICSEKLPRHISGLLLMILKQEPSGSHVPVTTKC